MQGISSTSKGCRRRVGIPWIGVTSAPQAQPVQVPAAERRKVVCWERNSGTARMWLSSQQAKLRPLLRPLLRQHRRQHLRLTRCLHPHLRPLPRPLPRPHRRPLPRPQPSPTPSPDPLPTPSPTPLPTPVPRPSPSEGDCSPVWGQCGGKDWNGSSCCQTGSVCQVRSSWYSQCIYAATDCAAVWGQCGGQHWSGATCCQQGSVCQFDSPWYSQCIPADPTPQPSVETTSEPDVDPEREAEPENHTEVEPESEADPENQTEVEPESEAEPENQTEVEPEAPTSPPEAVSCEGLCSRLNVSSSCGRCSALATELSCFQSYITNGNLAVPCSWSHCGCYADGDSLVECPDLAGQCSGTPLQRDSPRRLDSLHKRNLRARP